MINMEILKIYNNLITETAAQSCVRSFGKELFAQPLGGNEPNTTLEDDYLNIISDFTDASYGDSIKPEFLAAIKNLKGCMKSYPEVLVPETTKVYRGLTLPVSEFINSKHIIDTKQLFDYTYKTPYLIQSWSTSFDIASSFGNNEVLNEIADQLDLSNYNTPQNRQELLKLVTKEGLTIAFVLEYTSNSSEFLFKSKYFKKISANEHEEEILRIGNKPIVVKAKFNDHEDVFLSMNGLRLIKLINLAIGEI